ncbi:hypothetical protein GCM10007061_01840 [Kocuria marina]|nr:hypothetical protein GCM10007061_01840 [Kocuria marina]
MAMSTAQPAWASAWARCHTYTFMPPASPVPGWSTGDVCMLSSRTRGRSGEDTRPAYWGGVPGPPARERVRVTQAGPGVPAAQGTMEW